MPKKITLLGPNKDFENIKKINKQGVEYWEARELMPLFGYGKWENFKNVIDRATDACRNSDQEIKYHFPDAGKMIKIAKNTVKEVIKKMKIRDQKIDKGYGQIVNTLKMEIARGLQKMNCANAEKNCLNH